jgi:hypothetical protein
MDTSYNNSKCKQAEIYYYDFLCNENIEQIPKNLIEHIGQCPHCREKINQLNFEISTHKSTRSGNRYIAITDLLNLHLAYIGDKVDCSTVKPFLPIVLDPSLGIRIPTPITVHLDHCQQCTQDMKTIQNLNLTSTQSCLFSQLLADKTNGSTVSCRQAQAAIPAVSSMVYKDISKQVLKHLCTCKHCRKDWYEYRETICTKGRHENEKQAQKCSVCDQLTMSDIFDYVVPYGIDPTREDALFRSSIASHLRSCTVCLAKIQTLHNIVYGIVERTESKVATIYRINEFSEIQEPGDSSNLYSGYPISVEIANSKDIDNERPASPIRSIAATRRKTPILNTSRFLRSGIIAVAGVLIVIALFFRGSVAGAVTIGQVYSAIQNAKNVYISRFLPENANPVQERWISRTHNVKITKTGDELVLLDLKNNQRSIKNLGNNSIDMTELPRDYAADTKQSMSEFLGFMPFYSISDLPDNAEWNRVPDNELEIPVNNTEVYDLTWIDTTNANFPVYSKYRFTVDSQTYRPLNIRCYSKLDVDGQYILNTTVILEYLDDNAMKSVIEQFSE